MTTFLNLFRKPSALKLATAALEDCRRDQLAQAHLSEFHAAMVKVLAEREKRLQREVARLSKAAPAPVAPDAEQTP
jgi:hypothetical protein